MRNILLVFAVVCVVLIGGGMAAKMIAERAGARKAAALLARVEPESKPPAPVAAPPVSPAVPRLAPPPPAPEKAAVPPQDPAPQAAKPREPVKVKPGPTVVISQNAGGADLTPSQKARAALSLVGANAEAEKCWVAAINNPDYPPNERKNLIEDLNEDGLSDPKHPGPEDLPLILNRIRLIEELAPNAMDQVNADAFAEAHKDLVNMLNGKPVR